MQSPKNVLEMGKLILKDALVIQEMHSIDQKDLPELKIGDYPAIEALAFAEEKILEIHQRMKAPPKKYVRRTAGCF
ncbi:MAG: hypothetical protein HQ515_00775 [Phycisphaeraceae bacterium]|nr:hypothetical protein [Phycisphaeraceae bacterium]